MKFFTYSLLSTFVVIPALLWGSPKSGESDFIAPPIFQGGTPRLDGVFFERVVFTVQLDEPGLVRYVLVADGDPTPTVDDIVNGTGFSGAQAVTSGSVAVGNALEDTPGQLDDLTPGNSYDLYLVAEDDEPIPNRQVAATLLDITLPFARLDYSPKLNVASGVFQSKFSTAAEGEINPRGFAFNDDGSRVAVVGDGANTIFEYELSKSYDMTSAVSTGMDLGVTAQDATPVAMAYSPDGSALFMLGDATDAIYQYNTEVSFRLGGAGLQNSFDVSALETAVTDFAFNNDGTILYLTGTGGDKIIELGLGAPFDISSATPTGNSLDLTSIAINPTGFSFNTNGTQLFVLSGSTDRVYAFELDPFNLSSATYTGVSFDVTTAENNPMSIEIGPEGSLFVSGWQQPGITQFSLSGDAFIENPSDDGSVTGSIIIKILYDQFNNGGSQLADGVDYTIAGLPAGLTPKMDVATDGLSAVLTLTGFATNNDDIDDVGGLDFSFEPTAFVSGDNSLTENATFSSNLGINFFDVEKRVKYSTKAPISTANNPVGALDVSAVDGTPSGLAFSADGLTLFVLGNTNDKVTQYNLITPFDPTTASFATDLDILQQDATMNGITLDPSGTRMYLVGEGNDNVYEYFMSQPFDLSLATFTGKILDVSAQDTGPSDLVLSPSGEDLYVVGLVTDQIYQYTLSTPYDLATASYSGNSLAIGTQEGSPAGLAMDEDGRRIFVVGLSNDKVFEYHIASAPNISTATFTGIAADVTTEENGPQAIAFNNSFTQLFVLGGTADRIFSYDLSSFGFHEVPSNDGSVSGSIVLSLEGETFANAGGSLASGVDYTITGIPAGLSPQLDVSLDGRSAQLTLTGAATTNDDVSDVLDLIFDFANTAFNGGDAAAVTDATTFSSNLGVNFFNAANAVAYSSPILVSSGNYSGTSLSVSAQDGDPKGMAFSPDGFTLFVVGALNDAVYQYDLLSPFDLATASFAFSLDVSQQDVNMSAIAINPSGHTMVLAGVGNDRVYEYRMESAFDLSTAAFTGTTLDVSNEDTNPTGISFGAAGDKLYMVGLVTDAVYEYNLPSPYEIDGGTFSGASLAIATQESNATALTFNKDGTRLFIVGTSNDRIFQYALSSSFQLATAAYEGVNLFVQEQEGAPEALAFDPSGTQLLMMGSVSDAIYSYDLSFYPIVEQAANDGKVAGAVILSVDGDFFSNGGGSLTDGVDFTLSGIPAGLTPQIDVAANGLLARLTFSGTATANNNVDGISDFNITLNNSAFLGGDASALSNTSGASAGLGINFFDNEQSLNYAVESVVSQGQLSSNVLDVSANDNQPKGLAFSNDGLRVYVVGVTNDQLLEYDLSAPYDLTTATLNTSLAIGFEDANMNGVTFNPSGSRLLLLGQATNKVFEYELEIPFELSTAAITGKTLDVSGQDTSPTDLAFNDTGSQLFVVGIINDAIYAYDLAQPFDISSGSFSGITFSLSAQETNASSLAFNGAGSRMFIAGTTNDRIFQYDLSNSFDISTATFSEISLDISSVEGAPEAITLNRAGTELFVVGSISDQVISYELTPTAFFETAENTGQVEGKVIISLRGDTFTNGGGSLSSGVDFSLTSVPAGLTPEISVAGNGRFAALSFSGMATANDDTDDLSDLVFTFQNTAFTGGDASVISNSTATSSGLGIDFLANDKYMNYVKPADVLSAVASTSLSVSLEDTDPTGVVFTPDGSKMFVSGNTNDDIFEYMLITPWDVSTGSLSGTLDVTFENSSVSDLAIDVTGTRLFVLGEATREIREYQMQVPYSVGTAFFTGNLIDVSGQDTAPRGFTFSRDGMKLYVLGAANDQIFEYGMPSPYGLSNATPTGNTFSVSAQETNPTGIAFNINGSELFITGITSDQVHPYELSVPYDLTTATYAGSSLDVSLEDTAPQGLALEPNGGTLFVVGSASDIIQSYNLDLTAFTEAGANDGTVEGSILLEIVGDSFTNAGGGLSEGIDFTIDNLPSGLTGLVTVTPDARYALVQLGGSAFPSNDAEDLTDLQFTFTNSAFTSGDAASIANVIGASSSFGIDFLQDVTPPTLAIDAPVDTEISNAESTAVTVSGTTDAEDTQSVTLVFDDGAGTVVETPPVTSGTWTVTTDISTLAEGTITVTADVTDNAGNAATPANTSLTLDKTAPIISITTPIATDDIVDAGEAAPLTVSGTTDAPDGQTVTLIFDDGATTAQGSASASSGTWIVSTDISSLANGTVSLTAGVDDIAGNSGSTIANFTLSLDVVAPVVSSDTTQSLDLSPAFTGTIDDNTATISVTVNAETVPATNNGDGTWTVSAGTLSDLNVGVYDIGVSATDGSGNVGNATVQNALVILPAAPTAGQPANTSVSGFAATWNPQPGGVDGYLVDVSSTSNFSSFVTGFQNFVTTDTSATVGSLDYGADYYYRVRVRYLSSDTSAYSETVAVTTAIDPATATDSLALVSIYQNTGGDNWTNNSNWLSGRLRDWFGVTVSEARVTALSLPDNGLTGTIPGLTDALGALTTLNLAGNQLTAIGAVDGLTSLSAVNVSRNELQFGSLEQIVSLAQSTAVYSPQGAVLDSIRTLQEIGTTYIVDRTVSGSANTYAWFKDGSAFENTGGTFDLPITSFEDRGIFRVQVTNSLLPDLTLTSRPLAVRVSSLGQDREALLALYESTGGAEWTNGADWPNQDDITTWEGVIIASNRVVGLDLASSNLTGSVPPELGDIVSLVNLDLQGNLIEELPDLRSLTNLTSFNVAGNKLDFADLEPNAGISGIVYSPQRNFGEEGFEERIPKGLDYSLSFDIGGSANNYQWSLLGRTFEGDLPGATAFFYDISTIDYDNMGRYTLTVTSDSITDLTLTSHPQTVLATTTVTFNPFYQDIDGELAPLDEGEARLLQIGTARRRFDSAYSAAVVSDQLLFEEVVLGDYLMGIRTDTLLLRDKDGRTDSVRLLPTYYGGTFLWEEADTLFLRDALTEDIFMQQRPRNVEQGDGAVDLLVESDFEEDAGKDAQRISARRKVKRAGCSLRRRRRATGGRPENNDEYELIAYKETDDNGQVTFDNIPDGDYRLSIEYPGIPMDTTSYISFIIGAGGLEQTSITLEATVDEEGIAVELVEELGILRSLFDDLSVYPNPADRQMTIAYKKLIVGGLQVQLMNLHGGIMIKDEIKKGVNQQMELDVTNIPDGIYLLRFVHPTAKEQGVITYKVVIAH